MSELEVTGTTLKGWDPQDPNKWSSSIAWRTLAITLDSSGGCNTV